MNVLLSTLKLFHLTASTTAQMLHCQRLCFLQFYLPSSLFTLISLDQSFILHSFIH